MDVKFLQLDPERVVDRDAFVEPQRILDVFHPAISRKLKPDIAVVAAGYRQIFNPGVLGLGGIIGIEFSLMASSIGDGERRVEGDGIA